MEFGMTIPLQRRYKLKPPPYGREGDRFFCWDLHIISLGGSDYLLVVNCSCRFAAIVSSAGVSGEGLAEAAREAIRGTLLAEGLEEETVTAYLERTGAPALTKTHGRREVAFLNRAWEDAAALACLTEETERDQLLLAGAVNGLPRRCAGREGKESAAAFLAADLRERGFSAPGATLPGRRIDGR